MWHPNRRQWWTLAIFGIAGILGVLFGQRYGAFYATAAALIGGLLLWSQQTEGK